MGTGEKYPLRTLCYRQQNSHNPVLLTSWGSEQNSCIYWTVHFSHIKLSPNLCLTTASISCTYLFKCHISPMSVSTLIGSISDSELCFSKSSHITSSGTNPVGKETAHLRFTQPVAPLQKRSTVRPLWCTKPPQDRLRWRRLPDSKEGAIVTLKLCGLHNPCLSPLPFSPKLKSRLIILCCSHLPIAQLQEAWVVLHIWRVPRDQSLPTVILLGEDFCSAINNTFNSFKRFQSDQSLI